MKNIKNWNDLNLSKIDFLKDADNIYRTKDYIVKQKIISSFSEITMITRLISEDVYYLRTARRDEEYNIIFADRKKQINGKRIRTSMFARKYID